MIQKPQMEWQVANSYRSPGCGRSPCATLADKLLPLCVCGGVRRSSALDAIRPAAFRGVAKVVPDHSLRCGFETEPADALARAVDDAADLCLLLIRQAKSGPPRIGSALRLRPRGQPCPGCSARISERTVPAPGPRRGNPVPIRRRLGARRKSRRRGTSCSRRRCGRFAWRSRRFSPAWLTPQGGQFEFCIAGRGRRPFGTHFSGLPKQASQPQWD